MANTRMPRLRILALNNNDPTSTILNDARLFELAGYQSNRRPPYSQHLRKELLGQKKDVTIDRSRVWSSQRAKRDSMAWRALHAAVC
jgi:hypothetical protein